jgi:ribonuclease VapC
MIHPQVVLDASALLAMLHNEPGGEDVVDELENGVLSSVNLSEVIQQSIKRKVEVTALREDLEAVGLTIFPFNADDAAAAANLWPVTHSLGLSLGDRACLALAQRLQLPVLTADKIWNELQIGISVRLIR